MNKRVVLAIFLNIFSLTLIGLGFKDPRYFKFYLFFMGVNFIYLAYRGIIKKTLLTNRKNIFFAIDYFSFDTSRFRAIYEAPAVF